MSAGFTPAEEALMALLVHTAAADHSINERELDFMSRFLPGRDREQLRQWIEVEGGRSLDLHALMAALPTEDQRWTGLRFAIRMAWKDGAVSEAERAFLLQLVKTLGLPEGAVDTELAGMTGFGGAIVDPSILKSVFETSGWEAVSWREGALQGSLGACAPVDAVPILYVLIDDVEMVGFYEQGMSAWFREGPYWLMWTDIVTYTPVPTLAAALQIWTEDGKVWTLADFRLAALGRLFDRLFGAERTHGRQASIQGRSRLADE